MSLRGYQRLRIAPGMSASGMYWRCMVTPVTNVPRFHEAKMADGDRLAANYTTGMEAEWFDWGDATRKRPARLADGFASDFRIRSRLDEVPIG